jgi:hypothetical protein
MPNIKERIAPLEYRAPYLEKPAKVNLVVTAYSTHSLCIELIDMESREADTDLTTYLLGMEDLAPFQGIVDDQTENIGLEEFIKQHGLGRPTGQTIHYGLATLPVYQFDREKLLEFSLNGVEEYERLIGVLPKPWEIPGLEYEAVSNL